MNRIKICIVGSIFILLIGCAGVTQKPERTYTLNIHNWGDKNTVTVKTEATVDRKEDIRTDLDANTDLNFPDLRINP